VPLVEDGGVDKAGDRGGRGVLVARRRRLPGGVRERRGGVGRWARSGEARAWGRRPIII